MAASVNKVIVLGNLGADPDIRYTQDGTAVTNLRIATTEAFKDRSGNKQEKTEWHRVVAWGRVAEIAGEYLTKGSRVYVEGKLQTRKWTDKDGKDQYTTEIRVNDLKMLGGGTQQNNQNGASSQSNQQSQVDPFAQAPDFSDVPVDSDIPF